MYRKKPTHSHLYSVFEVCSVYMIACHVCPHGILSFVRFLKLKIMEDIAVLLTYAQEEGEPLGFDEVDIVGYPPSATFSVMDQRLMGSPSTPSSLAASSSPKLRIVESVSVGDRHQLKTSSLPIGARSLLLAAPILADESVKGSVKRGSPKTGKVVATTTGAGSNTRRTIVFRGLNKFPALDEDGGRDVFSMPSSVASSSTSSNFEDAWGGRTAGQHLMVSLLRLCSGLISTENAGDGRQAEEGGLSQSPNAIVAQQKLGGFLVSLFSVDGRAVSIMSKHALSGPHVDMAKTILEGQVQQWIVSSPQPSQQHGTLESTMSRLAKVLFEKEAVVLCECVDLVNDANHPIIERPARQENGVGEGLQYLCCFAVQHRRSRLELALPALEAARFVGDHLPFIPFVQQTVFVAPNSEAGPSCREAASTASSPSPLSAFPAFLSRTLLDGCVLSWAGGNTEGFVVTMECPPPLTSRPAWDDAADGAGRHGTMRWVRPFRIKLKTFRYRITRLLRSCLLGELSASGTDFWAQPAMLQVFVLWMRCNDISLTTKIFEGEQTPRGTTTWWRTILQNFECCLDAHATATLDNPLLAATMAQVMPNMVGFAHALAALVAPAPSAAATKTSPLFGLAMLCGLPGSGKSTLAGDIGAAALSVSPTVVAGSANEDGAPMSSSLIYVHLERDRYFAAEQAKILDSKRGRGSDVPSSLTTRDMKAAQRRAHGAVTVACRRASALAAGLSGWRSPIALHSNVVIVLDACNATVASRRHWRAEFPFQFPDVFAADYKGIPQPAKCRSSIQFALVYLDVPLEEARSRALRRPSHPVLPPMLKGAITGSSIAEVRQLRQQRVAAVQLVSNAVANVHKVFEAPCSGDYRVRVRGSPDSVGAAGEIVRIGGASSGGLMVVRRSGGGGSDDNNAPLVGLLLDYWGLTSSTEEGVTEVEHQGEKTTPSQTQTASLSALRDAYTERVIYPALRRTGVRGGVEKDARDLLNGGDESAVTLWFSSFLTSLYLFNKAILSIDHATGTADEMRSSGALAGLVKREMCRVWEGQCGRLISNSSLALSATLAPRRTAPQLRPLTASDGTMADIGTDDVFGNDDALYAPSTRGAERPSDSEHDDPESDAEGTATGSTAAGSGGSMIPLGCKRPRVEGPELEVPIDPATLLALDGHSHRKWVVYLDLTSSKVSETTEHNEVLGGPSVLLSHALQVLLRASRGDCEVAKVKRGNVRWIQGGLFDKTSIKQHNGSDTVSAASNVVGCLHSKLSPRGSVLLSGNPGGVVDDHLGLPLHCTLAFYGSGNASHDFRSKEERPPSPSHAPSLTAAVALALFGEVLLKKELPKCGGEAVPFWRPPRGSAERGSSTACAALAVLLRPDIMREVASGEGIPQQGLVAWLRSVSLPKQTTGIGHSSNDNRQSVFGQEASFEIFAVAANQKCILALVRTLRWVGEEGTDADGTATLASAGRDRGGWPWSPPSPCPCQVGGEVGDRQIPLHITIVLREKQDAHVAASELLVQCFGTDGGELSCSTAPPPPPSRKCYSNSFVLIELQRPLLVSDAFLAVARL